MPKKSDKSQAPPKQPEAIDGLEGFEPGDEQQQAACEAAAAETPAPEERTPSEVRLGLPFGTKRGYRQRCIDLVLDCNQADALQGLACGLSLSGAKLENGRPVKDMADAVRFVCEELARGAKTACR